MIEVQDLTFTYQGSQTPAVEEANFTVHQGEIFGFLGPSGAGKSTTQKILTKLLKGYRGKVKVLGKDLARWESNYYEHVGVSFELPNHYQRLTALENLNFFRSLYSVKTKDPMGLLEQVGLKEDAHRRVSQFSKGMQMRLTFARTLLNQPQIIFLDEPTSGLDPGYARTLRQMIRQLQQEGRTIFLTTHDMNAVDELCDRAAFIVDGRIVLTDSPRTLKIQKGKRQVQVEYRGADNSRQLSVFSLEKIGQNQDFLTLLREQDIETIHSSEATLEDIFIQVTGRSLE